jgi:hypothetical protein
MVWTRWIGRRRLVLPLLPPLVAPFIAPLARFIAPLARASRALGFMALFVAGVGVAAAVGAAWERAHTPSHAELRAALPPGEYHDGDPLPAAHPLMRAALASPGLDLRGACVWGRPGRQPYRGNVVEALQASGLPVAVRAQLAARAAVGARSGRLVIANDAIREEGGEQRTFASTGFAMTYGRTLCLETRVNFPAGHTEPADLYELQDDRGRRYSMMIPDVCGNVSIIGRAPRDSSVSFPRDDLPPHLKVRTRGGDPGDPAHTVPEPGTLACVLAALLAWGVVARWRAGRRGT